LEITQNLKSQSYC